MNKHVKPAALNLDDVKSDMIDCVFSHIDRMNDVCEQDTAEQIVESFTRVMNPLIEEYFEFAHLSAHHRLQMYLEFRSPEEIAAERARLDDMRHRFKALARKAKK